MRTVERIGFVLVLFFTVTLLERVGAQDGLSGMSDDGAAKSGGALSTSDLKITAPDGRVVMRLSATTAGGRIEIYNRAGRVTALLQTRADQNGEFALSDLRGNLRVGAACTETAGFSNYFDRNGKRSVYVGTNSARNGGLVNLYENGALQASAFTDQKGGAIRFYNHRNKAVALIGTTSDTGIGLMKLYNADAEARLVAEGGRNAGSLFLQKRGGKYAVQLGGNSSGGGYIVINNSLGARAVFLGSTTGSDPNEGVLELLQPNGKLGAVARAYRRGPYFSVFDSSGRAKKSLR